MTHKGSWVYLRCEDTETAGPPWFTLRGSMKEAEACAARLSALNAVFRPWLRDYKLSVATEPD